VIAVRDFSPETAQGSDDLRTPPPVTIPAEDTPEEKSEPGHEFSRELS
jgi:hypothetical protein